MTGCPRARCSTCCAGIRASQERTELDVADVKVRMSALGSIRELLLALLGTLSQRLDRFDGGRGGSSAGSNRVEA